MYSVDLNIFVFDDFRVYLKRSVQCLRDQSAAGLGSEFSFRKFSATAGFTSPNFLILLMKGERNLSEESAVKIAAAFGLEKLQKTFFISLVKYNQAKTSSEKYLLAGELLKLRSKNNLYFIRSSEFEYYSYWINIAIRELILIEPQLTALQMADRLSPKQKLHDVEASLQLLQELGLITLINGRWQTAEKNISTGENFVSSSVVHFHKQMIELAKESLDRYPRAEREVSASTVALTRSQFESVRKKIQELRLEILALAETETCSAGKEIYQFNFQTFPLTTTTSISPMSQKSKEDQNEK